MHPPHPYRRPGRLSGSCHCGGFFGVGRTALTRHSGKAHKKISFLANFRENFGPGVAGDIVGDGERAKGQRELRDLTSFRSTFVKERANLINRLQKSFENAHIKLASVVTHIADVSGKAIVAVAHSILIIALHLIKNGKTYQDLGSNYFDRRNSATTASRMVHRLEQLGYKVRLESPVPLAIKLIFRTVVTNFF